MTLALGSGGLVCLAMAVALVYRKLGRHVSLNGTPLCPLSGQENGEPHAIYPVNGVLTDRSEARIIGQILSMLLRCEREMRRLLAWFPRRSECKCWSLRRSSS